MEPVQFSSPRGVGKPGLLNPVFGCVSVGLSLEKRQKTVFNEFSSVLTRKIN